MQRTAPLRPTAGTDASMRCSAFCVDRPVLSVPERVKMTIEPCFKSHPCALSPYCIISTTSHTVSIDQDLQPNPISSSYGLLGPCHMPLQRHMVQMEQKAPSLNTPNWIRSEVNDPLWQIADEGSPPRKYGFGHSVKHVQNLSSVVCRMVLMEVER